MEGKKVNGKNEKQKKTEVNNFQISGRKWIEERSSQKLWEILKIIMHHEHPLERKIIREAFSYFP